jgi:hypothetical protein
VSPKPPLAEYGRYGPLIESIAKTFLIGSLVLYSVGLIITNLYYLTFGLASYNLVQAQYVLTGYSWLSLTLLGGVLTSSFNYAFSLLSARRLRNEIFYVLRIGVAPIIIYELVRATLWKKLPSPWLLIQITLIAMVTYISIGSLVKSIAQYVSTEPQDVEHKFILRMKLTCLCFLLFMSLAMYAYYIHPHIQNIGGGSLPKAQFQIKNEKRDIITAMGLKVSAKGMLQPVYLLSTDSDSFIVVLSLDSSRPGSKAYRISKDQIDSAIFSE